MTVSVGMFDTGYTRLKHRIDAMGLDIDIRTFDKDANFNIGGAKVPAAETEVDIYGSAPIWRGDLLAACLSISPSPASALMSCRHLTRVLIIQHIRNYQKRAFEFVTAVPNL